MNTLSNKVCTLLACLSLPLIQQLSAGELEDLIELKQLTNKELTDLKATGLGKQHRKIIVKEEQISIIKDKIIALKETKEEIIILLNGFSSLHMKGNVKFAKTETALPTLQLQGWKIKTIIPTGEDKAYVWLTRE